MERRPSCSVASAADRAGGYSRTTSIPTSTVLADCTAWSDAKPALKGPSPRSTAAWAGPDRWSWSLTGRVLSPWIFVVAVTAYILADKSGTFSAGVDLPHQSVSKEIVQDRHHAVLLAERQPMAVPSAAQLTPHYAASARRASGSSGSSSDGNDDGHQYDALLFLFNAIVLGALITHLTTFKMFHGLQQTVVLFVLGVFFSLVQEGLKMNQKLGIFGRSYDMWMDIDPHLVLFTMLPPLLTGDAMSLDTSVARRVFKQCIYLASVGVLFNAFATALFLKAYLGWSFLLSLTTGAILCATDPVAVVALLKELGASPTLTVQIQGESLLNDGTAIVLYTIAYNILKGESYDVDQVIMFMIKKAMCAWFLGMVIGYAFFLWIRAASNKLEHHNSMIQVSLTLCCAYWSFIMAEGIFHISGVLATVAAALVLAHYMWPVIVSKESMHTTWHMLEYLGNTLIFFLAGALTGKVMVHIPWGDYLHLIVIYIVLIVIRFLLLMLSRPVLRLLEEDKTSVSLGEVIVMTWGGLRGAVGLALAMVVKIERAGGTISEENANRVLFFTGGVAALTLIVNASTCPAIVKALGITQLPATKRRMLRLIHRRLLELSKDKAHPEAVTKAIKHMLDEMEEHIDADTPEGDRGTRKSRDGVKKDQLRGSSTRESLESMAMSKAASSLSITASKKVGRLVGYLRKDYDGAMQPNSALLEEYAEYKRTFSELPPEQLQELYELAKASPVEVQEQEILRLVERHVFPVEAPMARAMTEAFLGLIRSVYMKQMDKGDFERGATEAEVLLGSITLALNRAHLDLCDFNYIWPFVRKNIMVGAQSTTDFNYKSGWRSEAADSKTGTFESVKKSPSKLHVFLNSIVFQIAMLLAINASSICIFVEEEYRTEKNDSHQAWMYLDAVFVVIFTIEFLLNFADQKCRYFADSWNVFDFILVVLGIIGLTVNIMAVGKVQDSKLDNVSADGRVVRVARVFRVLRLIRLLRLVRYFHLIKARLTNKEETLQIREHMQKTCVLQCFVRAHLSSQKEMVQYFGTHEKVDSIEVARCLLQSQCAIYKAMSVGVAEERRLDRKLLKEITQVRESKAIAEELERFVMDAHCGGVINAREAESILRPLHGHMQQLMKRIQEQCLHMNSGIQEEEVDPLQLPGNSEDRSSGGNNDDRKHDLIGPLGAPNDLPEGEPVKAPSRRDVPAPLHPPPMMSNLSTDSLPGDPPRMCVTSVFSENVADFSPPGAVLH